MTEVSKNVIMDLMPLYLAGEASEESAALVQQYVESSPEMAEILDQMKKAEALKQAPVAFSTETAIRMFQEAKKWTVIRTLGLTLIIGMLVLAALVVMLAYDLLSF